jgi:hypothetical protein
MQQTKTKPTKAERKAKNFQAAVDLVNQKLGTKLTTTSSEEVQKTENKVQSHGAHLLASKSSKHHKHLGKDSLDIKRAIEHFESEKESYANSLLYPETFMSRIPFMCPVPTALCRLNNVVSFTISPPSGVADSNLCFYYSFLPEALNNPDTGSARFNPFSWVVIPHGGDDAILTVNSINRTS